MESGVTDKINVIGLLLVIIRSLEQPHEEGLSSPFKGCHLCLIRREWLEGFISYSFTMGSL